MEKRSRTKAAASIEERPRPSRATEEWEYIHAPIVGYSDDSADETYVLSSTDEEGEEKREVLSIIDEEEEEEEDDDGDETDSEDELRTGSMERHAEEDILPSVESGSESGSESESGSGSGSDHDSEPETVESSSDESGSDAPPTPPRKLKRKRALEATEQSTGPRPAKKRRHGKAKETPVVNPYLELIARDQARSRVVKARKCRCYDVVA